MKLPLSIDLAAISWANYMSKRLVRFGEGRQGEAPSWEGRGNSIKAQERGVPITDRAWWEGRYVLCPVRLRAQTESGTLEVELRELRQLLDVKGAIEVHSEFLAIFDITKIVIKNYSATQMTEANYQAVSISAVSDEDYEIYSNEY